MGSAGVPPEVGGMRTGLVLGGGGMTGIAWEVGVLKGLREGGVEVTSADLVIGTSAGSVVAALVTCEDLDDLYAEQTSPPDEQDSAVFGLRAMLTLGVLMALPGDGRTRRARVGRVARRAHPGPGTERLAVFESRLRRPDGSLLDWPDRDLRITAVDATTGAFTVFDRHGDVDLLHAVAASCAVPMVWSAIEVDGRAYLDGGMRSPANADLATGCDVVLALVPLPRTVTKRHSMPEQLRRTGALWTAWISPDAASLEAIGRNVLDPAMRVGAAKAGAAQGRRMAAEVAERWPVPRRPRHPG